MNSFINMSSCQTASGLVGLVQPMLWDYTPNLTVDRTGRKCIQTVDVIKQCAELC